MGTWLPNLIQLQFVGANLIHTLRKIGQLFTSIMHASMLARAVAPTKAKEFALDAMLQILLPDGGYVVGKTKV